MQKWVPVYQLISDLRVYILVTTKRSYTSYQNIDTSLALVDRTTCVLLSVFFGGTEMSARCRTYVQDSTNGTVYFL